VSKVHILFENEDWLPPLRAALERRGVPYEEHFTAGGVLDMHNDLPDGVFLNRMSPSSHTRGHQGGVVYTRELLGIIEASGRRVINGSRAFALEVSKLQQDASLRAAGILTPHTVGVVEADAKAASRQLKAPFITKHNQGGKGLGVQLFKTHEAFDAFVDDGGLAGGSPDGVVVLQQYIQPAEPFITRVEIVDGVFQYAIRSSTEQGFELCPADACDAGDAFCPVGDIGRFALADEVTADDALVLQYVEYLRVNQLDLAGIEFVTDSEGRRWTYDVNGTTNYNGAVEAAHGFDGMDAIAALAERELGKRCLAAK
jgi:glutathione synthase/RimK-type ligase-like ATP-grasp enzyme